MKLDIDGVICSPSAFSDADAWWVNGKEIAHLDDGHTVDIRIGRKHISARRDDLRVRARSKGSDWCEVDVTEVALIEERSELVASQHRVEHPNEGAA